MAGQEEGREPHNAGRGGGQPAEVLVDACSPAGGSPCHACGTMELHALGVGAKGHAKRTLSLGRILSVPRDAG